MSTRRLMLNSHRSGEIPSEYRAVSYIERSSNTNAYIDTGVIPSNTINVEGSFLCTSAGTCFGSRTAYFSNAYMLVARTGDNKTRWDYGAVQSGNGAFCVIGTKYDFHTNGSTITITDGSNEVSLGGGGTLSNPTYPIFLFTFNNAGSISAWSGRFYGFRIYDNGTLIRDFRPVQRKIDGVFGMYDVVSQAFKTSPNGVLFGGGYKCLNIRRLQPSKERRVAA